ncbi:unnamed protein product [Rotaria sordida]|uniref:Uncharacterized protein n=1 Tax=Rotaria sordida TaxID=392033 RepID=A0A819AXK9_9BILA|nr:unnamed protein product [Rotaria sordida]CAF0840429.1 unnamed protein product [Rotaria sordida]CAF0882376.1 unnamed protein product [Rotaria sordida]CAF0988007.1 unnamed protein product [Rotaria sordida]CAF0988651.1 unnamed protein product [Rotaria sordida]
MIHGRWITEKHVDGIIDRDDDYWVVKTNARVNRPKFPAYIRFFNTHTSKCEYQLDCSTSALILYYNSPPQIVFRTTGHIWSEGDSYFVTLDEGVLFSNDIENSTEYSHPKFWKFHVIRPLNQE